MLTKIKGNTYYIKAPTNIGVYSYKNKNCLLIDTGRDNSAARKIEDDLKENNLHVKYIINTHSHIDHVGGNPYFKNNYTGCLVYTSLKEKLYMENNELISTILYTAPPLRDLESQHKEFNVDYILDYGINKINDEKFDIHCLKGHSVEGIGVVTSDKVCFLGDAIFSEYTLNKYSFPYLFNIEDSVNSLNRIKEIDADYFVISHGDDVLDKEKIVDLADKNICNINKYSGEILELLEKPLSKEQLLENLIILNDLYVNFRQYHLYFTSMSAFLAYLFNSGKITYSVENGNIYYYRD